jgi:quercetin dioxygenase-like cupin family protein
MEHAMPNSQEIEAKSHSPVPQGYVLGAEEGEHLIHFRDGGNIFIKVDPVTGSNNLGLGTQQLPKGSGIPVHRHLHKDEAFYILEGSGMVTLNDVYHPCERGGTIFIPKNTWHGFSSPDQELVLLWIMVPPGLDGFFRENLQPTGSRSTQLLSNMGKNSGRRGERFAHWHNAEARLCSCAQACRAWRRCHAAHSTAHVCDMDAAKRRLHSRGGRLSRHVGEGHREDLWAPLAGLYAERASRISWAKLGQPATKGEPMK